VVRAAVLTNSGAHPKAVDAFRTGGQHAIFDRLHLRISTVTARRCKSDDSSSDFPALFLLALGFLTVQPYGSDSNALRAETPICMSGCVGRGLSRPRRHPRRRMYWVTGDPLRVLVDMAAKVATWTIVHAEIVPLESQ
jgi:hypothetical protein